MFLHGKQGVIGILSPATINVSLLTLDYKRFVDLQWGLFYSWAVFRLGGIAERGMVRGIWCGDQNYQADSVSFYVIIIYTISFISKSFYDNNRSDPNIFVVAKSRVYTGSRRERARVFVSLGNLSKSVSLDCLH